MQSSLEIQQKIDQLACRLSNLSDSDSKRIRKRILASLGKLKKDLVDAL
jgi:hypothetical protein